MAAAAMALVASLASGATMNWVDGLFYDLSLATHGVRPGTGGEPVAVIAMDRGSLDSEELAATPRVLFGPIWAKLIEGLAKARVKAIGFDIIFSYSANRFPALDAQYDREFYDASPAIMTGWCSPARPDSRLRRRSRQRFTTSTAMPAMMSPQPSRLPSSTPTVTVSSVG